MIAHTSRFWMAPTGLLQTSLCCAKLGFSCGAHCECKQTSGLWPEILDLDNGEKESLSSEAFKWPAMAGARFRIVNADAFGLSEETNRGIIKAHENGIITTARLMASQPRRMPPLSIHECALISRSVCMGILAGGSGKVNHRCGSTKRSRWTTRRCSPPKLRGNSKPDS